MKFISQICSIISVNREHKTIKSENMRLNNSMQFHQMPIYNDVVLLYCSPTALGVLQDGDVHNGHAYALHLYMIETPT